MCAATRAVLIGDGRLLALRKSPKGKVELNERVSRRPTLERVPHETSFDRPLTGFDWPCTHMRARLASQPPRSTIHKMARQLIRIFKGQTPDQTFWLLF